MRLLTILKLLLLLSAILVIAGIVTTFTSPLSSGPSGMVVAGLVIAGHAVIGLGLTVMRDRGKLPRLMLLGLLLCGLALATWLSAIWIASMGTGIDDGRVQGGAILSGWATLVLVLGVTVSQPVTTLVGRCASRGTVLAVALLAASLPVVVLLFDRLAMDDRVLRAYAALSLLAIAGLGTLAVQARVRGPAPAHRPYPQVTVVCPRCALQQAMESEGDRCRRCHLHIKVQVP